MDDLTYFCPYQGLNKNPVTSQVTENLLVLILVGGRQVVLDVAPTFFSVYLTTRLCSLS